MKFRIFYCLHFIDDSYNHFIRQLNCLRHLNGLFRTLIVAILIFILSSNSAFASNIIQDKLEKQILDVIKTNPEIIIESIEKYRQDQKDIENKKLSALLKKIKKKPVEFIGDSSFKGNSEAKILFIEFSDFQCPFCASVYPVIDDFMLKHKNDVVFAYKHFPLSSIHPNSVTAAKASWAASQQGKFWEFHNILFEEQNHLGEALYISTAKLLGLNIEKFNHDRISIEADTAIDKDTLLANKLNISGTPFFVMGDQLFSGVIEVAELEALLNKVKLSIEGS